MWVYTVYLALCIHLMNAKRVQLVDSNDGLFCECKTAESSSECNWQRKFYHPEVKKCCRMAKKKSGFGKVFHKAAIWKSTYVRQDAKDLCLEERRPFEKGACCTVAGSAEFFGESMRIELSHAKIYSMAHPKMTSEPKEEDYRKKSKIFIEMDAVSSGTVNYFRNRLPADKIIEGLKQLQQKDQLLQCEENFKPAKQMLCQVRKQPICCCTQETLDRKVKFKVGADSPMCLTKDCAPNTDRVYLKGEIERTREWIGYSDSKRVNWDRFEPFHKCPANFSWKGLTFVKRDLGEQLAGHRHGECSESKTVDYFDSSIYEPEWRERTWCIEKYYFKVCPAGKVLYSAFRGHTLKDAVLCPSGYKSNLPGDRFDSKCNCGDVEKVEDSFDRWSHGTGEVKGGKWEPFEWLEK